jgi:hypothetical protein
LVSPAVPAITEPIVAVTFVFVVIVGVVPASVSMPPLSE